MKEFSKVNVIQKEILLMANRNGASSRKLVGRWFNNIINPRNPKYTFSFFVPKYLYIRATAFCDDIADDVDGRFTHGDLVEALYDDFLEYVRRTNNLHDIHNRLIVRDLSPTTIQPYTTEKAKPGVVFEEMRGIEEIKTRLEHKAALKGELLLRDMGDIYPNHKFVLENILEIVFCDFMDDYRRGLIKNPIQKILQYV